MFHRVLTALYSEPWLIQPEVHGAMRRVMDRYLEHGPARADAVKSPAAEPMAMGGDFQRSENCPGLWMNRNGLAVYRVSGILGKHLSMMEIECGGGYDLAWTESILLELQSRTDIHTAVMIANSPGGHAIGLRDVALLTKEVAESKRMIAFVDSKAASAMYYLSAGCPEIYSTPGAILGNIGAYSFLLDRSKQFEMNGLALELFTSGPLKAAGIEGLALTPEQRSFFQSKVDDLAGPFFQFVRENRPSVSESVFDGGWYGPEEAQVLGLCDGTFPTLSHLMNWLEL